jgi:Uma2 family endonuclease
MSANPQKRWTVEEYLAFEKSSDTRHAFIDSEIYAMSGGTARHSQITQNAASSLHLQLRRKPCIVYNSEVQVKVNAAIYTYPDVPIVCGEPQFENGGLTLVNPTVIIEVSSPSTEKDDRFEKFQHYRSLASLQQYILIAQKAPHVESYTRQPNGTWRILDSDGLDAAFDLPAIGCTLALADIYEKVTFDENAS